MSRRHFALMELHEEVKRLRKRYRVPPKPVPSDEDLREGDAFLIESHAALEYYFEELCRKALYASVMFYSVSGEQTPLLRSLTAAHYWKSAANATKEPFAFRSEVESLKASVRWHLGTIGKNNGIQRKYLYSLLLPFGFDELSFDEVWLANMTAFGVARGAVAHGQPLSPPQKLPIRIRRQQSAEIAIYGTGNYDDRTQIPPWEVDDKLEQLLPEAYAWDSRVWRKCRIDPGPSI